MSLEQGGEMGSKPLSKAFLIIFSSATLYLITYFYEYGYFSKLGIPFELISISLSCILSRWAIILGFLVFLIPGLSLFSMIIANAKENYLSNLLFPLLIPLVLVSQFIYFHNDNKSADNNFVPIIVVFVLVVFFQFGFPLITQRSGTYKEKLKKQEDIEKEVKGMGEIINELFGKEYTYVLLIFCLFISIALNAGSEEALKQEKFFLCGKYSDMVIIRTYEDHFLCVGVNRGNNSITNQYKIIPKFEADTILTYENMGQLKKYEDPQQPKSSTSPVNPTQISNGTKSTPESTIFP
jgi:hypothetical protein